MRTVALGVYKGVAGVAVCEDGVVRGLGRIETVQLREFAVSLGATDHVVLESAAMMWAIADLLSRHAGRVTLSNLMRTGVIAWGRSRPTRSTPRVLA